VHLGISCFCSLEKINKLTGLLKMLIYIDSIVSLLITIVSLLVVLTPTFIVVIFIVRSTLRYFFLYFRITSLNLSVTVISESARFNKEIIFFKSVLN
jgi:hypothetical protein